MSTPPTLEPQKQSHYKVNANFLILWSVDEYSVHYRVWALTPDIKRLLCVAICIALLHLKAFQMKSSGRERGRKKEGLGKGMGNGCRRDLFFNFIFLGTYFALIAEVQVKLSLKMPVPVHYLWIPYLHMLFFCFNSDNDFRKPKSRDMCRGWGGDFEVRERC